MNRLAGPFAWLYWLKLVLNVLTLQLMWWPRLRRSTTVLAVVAVCVIVGMWCERAMLLVTSLSRSALDRKSVVCGKSVAVRVDHGGRRIIKTQYTNKN